MIVSSDLWQQKGGAIPETSHEPVVLNGWGNSQVERRINHYPDESSNEFLFSLPSLPSGLS